MILNRSKNTIRNAKFGVVNRIVAIIFPFIVRTIFIKILGEEFLGLNSLFTSILTVLNMTELGFSSAITFCMYKPIANDDKETINALLYFYKKVYFYIGCIILIVGCLLIPFLPHLINGSYPDNINIIIVYLVFLINTVISYFLYGYLTALITAFQREDIVNKISIIISSSMYILQIILLINIKNYYIYILTMPLFTILNNLITVFLVKKLFPQYVAKGELNREYKLQIKEKVKGLIVNKICIVSRNAFDSIFVSMFLGLTATAIYNNYYYIMNSVVSITSVFITAVSAGVGNSVSLESLDKNYKDMNRMNFIYMWFSGWCTICLLCLYQPFMKLWIGEDSLLSFLFVILICLYFYALKMGDIRSIYDQANGLWWENRYRTMLEAFSNIILNYLLGKYFGLYGIVLATLLSILIINFGMGSQIIFKYYYKDKKVSDYYMQHLKYALVTIFVSGITYYICSFIRDGLVFFVIKIFICCFIPNVIYFFIYRNTIEFKESVPWLMSRFHVSRIINKKEKEC